MSNLTCNQNVNTAAFLDDPDPATYPFISGLRAMGMNAILRNGAIGLTPPDKVTSGMISVARKNRDAIIAEINNLAQKASADMAADHIAACIPRDRFKNLSEAELDEIEEAYARLFYYANAQGYSSSQYWEPPEPKPLTRPYVYLEFDKLIPPGGAQTKLYIKLMEAAADGVDYCLMLDS